MRTKLIAVSLIGLGSLAIASVLPSILSVSDCSPNLGDLVSFTASYPGLNQRQVSPNDLANSPYAGYPQNPLLHVLCFDSANNLQLEVLTTFADNQRRISNGFRSTIDLTLDNPNRVPMFCNCYLSHLKVTPDGVEQFTDAVNNLDVLP